MARRDCVPTLTAPPGPPMARVSDFLDARVMTAPEFGWTKMGKAQLFLTTTLWARARGAASAAMRSAVNCIFRDRCEVNWSVWWSCVWNENVLLCDAERISSEQGEGHFLYTRFMSPWRSRMHSTAVMPSHPGMLAQVIMWVALMHVTGCDHTQESKLCFGVRGTQCKQCRQNPSQQPGYSQQVCLHRQTPPLQLQRIWNVIEGS